MAGESAREVARRAREKAEWLERRAELFERGAEGESATAAVLSRLPAGWTATHDVRWPNRRLANIDHVVVGPGGIFVIDSKNWSGNVSYVDGHLRQNGRSREKTVAGCADAGLAIAELVGPYSDRVFPVLCFLGETEMTGWCRDVMICSTATLEQMLLTRPPALSADESLDAWLRLDAQLRAATAGAATAPLPSRRVRPGVSGRALNGASGRRRPRKRQPVLRPLVGLVLLFAVAFNGPEIAKELGDLLSGRLTATLEPAPSCVPTKTRTQEDGRASRARSPRERANRDAPDQRCD